MSEGAQKSKIDLARLYGSVVLDPSTAIEAGGWGTWRLTYTAGSLGVAPGDGILVGTDSDTDWGIPQMLDPTAAEYLTARAPEGVRLVVTADKITSVQVRIVGRALAPGEQLVVTFGDRSGGGPGSSAQTFVEEQHYFQVSVDVEGTGELVPLPDPPAVPVVGGDVQRLVVLVPSVVVVGEPFRLSAMAQDAWGNPSYTYRGKIVLAESTADFPVEEHAFTAENRGVCAFAPCTLSQPGIHRIAVTDEEAGLHAESNPIQCLQERPAHRLYWGDPHGGQLHMACKIPDFFRYARDVSSLDFAGYQANAHRLSTEDWTVQQRAEREFHEPGRFVPLPGMEWSGGVGQGGHHNVYFRRYGQPIRRSRHLDSIADQDDHDTDLPHVLDLYQAYRHADAVITPHVGGGRADLTFHEPTLEPAIEVTSTHGTFEWFLEDSLRRGYRLGFIGGSDGYTGRPGGEFPGHIERRYAKGGYAAVYAQALTLPSILEGLKARRAYGTTGARILVRCDGDGHPMGQEYTTAEKPTITATVAGTAPLESIELMRGLEPIHRHSLERGPASNRVRILWQGASRRTSYSGVIWDGSLEIVCGSLALVETLRFDSPRSHIVDRRKQAIRWHSVTCGYRSGIIVDVDAEADAEMALTVNTSLTTRAVFGGSGDADPVRIAYTPAESVSFHFRLADLEQEQVLKLGTLGRKVVFSLDPMIETRDVTFSFTDPAPRPGINPYWLRVVQADMEMAWTSPVYVDYVA